MEQKILEYLQVLPIRYHDSFEKYWESFNHSSLKNIRKVFEEYLILIVNELSYDERNVLKRFLYGNDINHDVNYIDLEEVLKLQKKQYIRDIAHLKDTDFTIICSNCVGGIIYHNLGLEFKSPTINLFLMPNDFIKFCNDLEYYIACEMTHFVCKEYDYPIGKIDDILIYGLHYSSFEELKSKWDSRKERICWDKLFFIMSEREGCSEEDILNFDRLPYQNKIIFVHKPMENIGSAYYLQDTEEMENGEMCVVPLSGFKKNENKRFIDDFDYVSFLNRGL